jgi:hypothetical protein
MLKNSNEWKSGDDLDRALDAALTKYAAVEPRAGLEERIRAHLRAEGTSSAAHAWWNWRVAAVLAAVLVIAASLAWRWNKASHRPVVLHRPEVKQAPIAPYRSSGETAFASQRKPSRHKTIGSRPQPQVAAVEPKLDVFPSPLPLSEQEKILSLYVEKYPQDAALVAEARMEALRQQAEERRLSSEQDEKQ